MSAGTSDRVGLGWRPELAAGIFANLDRIDVVEVMADDFIDAPAARLRALRTLAAQVPVSVHGTKLGLASASPVETRWLDHTARVIEAARPDYWSEHLAFVRSGGIEIGHLAAPPRTTATVDGLARNVAAATRVVGMPPLLENIATLIDPPASSMDEASWIGACLAVCDSGLLLDLHNLHCNAVNFGYDSRAFLARIPVERVRAIHIAGGRPLPSGRLLDDHLNPVPDPVFELLRIVASLAPQPLDVVLERDGAFPRIDELLAELDQARRALAAGRARPALAA
jgi:uncharacterized protein